MNNIARGIYEGSIGVEGSSGLRNPVVKLAYLLSPIAVLMSQQVSRALDWPRLNNVELVVLLLILYVGATFDFSSRGWPKFFRRSLMWALFLLLLLLILLSPIKAVEHVAGVFTDAYRFVPVIGEVSATSWLLILFIFVMFAAVRNFTTRDAFWVGRKVLWGAGLFVYSTFVTTFSLMFSALPLRLRTSWIIARDKAALMRNVRLLSRPSVLARISFRFWTFVSTVVTHNRHMAIAIETLVYQRGLFSDGYRDNRQNVMSQEDYVGIVLLLLAISVVAGSVILRSIRPN